MLFAPAAQIRRKAIRGRQMRKGGAKEGKIHGLDGYRRSHIQ